jgi:hypothetical protein
MDACTAPVRTRSAASFWSSSGAEIPAAARAQTESRGRTRTVAGWKVSSARVLGDGGAEEFGDLDSAGEGHDGEARYGALLHEVDAMDGGFEPVPTLVDCADERFCAEARAQRGDTARHAIGGDMHVGPEGLLELSGRDDVTGVREQNAKGGEFFGGEVNGFVTAEQSAVRFEAEAAEGEA